MNVGKEQEPRMESATRIFAMSFIQRASGTLALALAVVFCASLSTSAFGQEWGPRRTVRQGSKSGSTAGQRQKARPKEAVSGGSRSGREAFDVLLSRYLADPSDDDAWRAVVDGASDHGGSAVVAGRLVAESSEGPSWAAAGRLWLVAGETDKAIEAFAKADDGKRAWLAAMKADALLRAGRAEEAAAAYELAATRGGHPGDAAAWWKQAAGLWSAGGNTAAAAACLERMAQELGGAKGRLEAATAASQLGLGDDAWARWTALAEAPGGDAWVEVTALSEMAALAEARGDVEQAIALLRKARYRATARSGLGPEVEDRLLDLYRRMGRLGEWVAELEPSRGKSYRVTFLLGTLYEELGREADALAAYREALRLEPRSAEAQRALVALLTRSASVDDIVAEYRALLELVRGDPAVHLELADFLYRSGLPGPALDEVARVARARGTQPDVLGQVAERMLRFGAPPGDVEAVLIKLRRLEPREEAHLLNLGELYFGQGEEEKAWSVWQEILRVFPSGAEGHYRLAQAAATHAMNTRAIEQYERALKADGGRADVRRDFATLLVKLGRYEPAIAQWRQVIGLCGGDEFCLTDARSQLLGVWSRAGRLPTEVTRLEAEFSASPPNLDSGRLLAEAHQMRGDWAAAASVLERILVHRPDGIDAVLGLELLYARLNRPGDAARLAARAAELDPAGRSEHLARAAEYELKEGASSDALATAERLVRLRPTDPAARVALGDVFWQLDRVDDAIAAYREAVRLGHRDGATIMRLASLYRAVGKFDEELALLGEMLAAPPPGASLVGVGRSYVEAAERAGRLREAERVLLPRALGTAQQATYRQIYIDVVTRLLRAMEREGSPAAPGAIREREELSARSLKPMLDALAEDEFGTKVRALGVLQVLRPPGATLALVRLLDAREPELQRAALAVLAHLRASAAAPALAKMVESARGDDKLTALWALGAIPGDVSSAALLRALGGASTLELHMAALALGMQERDDARRALDTLANHRDPGVRLAVALALGCQRRGEVVARAAEALGLVPARAGGVQDVGEQERLALVWAAGRVGGDAATRVIVSALLGASLPLQQQAAWAVLDAGGDSLARMEAIREAYLSLQRFDSSKGPNIAGSLASFASPRPFSEAEATQAMERLLPAAKSAVTRVLEGPDGDALASALAALGGDSSSSGLTLGALLSACAPASAGEVSDSSAAELCQRQQGIIAELLVPVVPRLLELAAQGSDRTRAMALRLVAKLGRAQGHHAPELGARLEAGLASPVSGVATAACDAAGIARFEALGPALAQVALQQREWTVQVAALRALALVGGNAAHEAGMGCYQSPYVTVRIAAIRALASGGRPDAGAAIASRLTDPERDAVLGAIEALRTLGGSAALRELEAFRRASSTLYWPAIDHAITSLGVPPDPR